ncbi:hypothetical protein [Parabacteroides goldsteinii]|jgi:hypothetical protein|uniref:hypothetical protein n=1 Tax=Parabacteroides goldsteinii TaxID=328812 RepID=UPI00101C609C|nr:hypothetical protein [Parabacteroides goldsteinii]
MKRRIAFCLLLLVCVLVYFKVLQADFLYYWDDQVIVMNQYTVGGWSWNNLWHICTDFHAGQYAPVMEMNFLTLYTFFGYNPFWFHLANLCWHLGCVCLTGLFIVELLKTHGRFSNKEIHLIAFLTAFIFSIHPFNVESVAWVSAVKILIYSFFYLLATICYLRYIKTMKEKDYLLTLFLFAVSFLAKEQAVTLPLLLILIDWFCHRNLKEKALWVEKLPFFILSLFFGIITILSQAGGGDAPVFPFGQRIVLACYTLFEYLTKSLFPIGLNYLYPFPILPEESLPVRFWIYPLLVICIISWLWVNRKNKLLLFGACFFVIHLLVALNIISTSRQAIVADRYSYMSNIGIIFLVVVMLVRLKSKWGNTYKWKGALVAFLMYSFYLGGYTYIYSTRWENTETVKLHINELLKERETEEKNQAQSESVESNY